MSRTIDSIEITDFERKQALRLSPEIKTLIQSYCQNEEVHSVLNVTFKDVFESIMTWILQQPYDVYVELIRILESEMNASRGMCFTGRLSRLVNCLNGFHPDVIIRIADSEQISNRVLIVVNREKDKGTPREEIIALVKKELTELEMPEDKQEEWLHGIDDILEPTPS